MQYRYRVMRTDSGNAYLAQMQTRPAHDTLSKGSPWVLILTCKTRWGAIWECHAAARRHERHLADVAKEDERRTNPVWSATLPRPPNPVDLS